MSQITAQQVIKLCESRLDHDQNLAKINGAIQQKGLSISDALDIAARFGTIMRARGTDEETLTNGIVAAFKAAAYRKLQQNGIGFSNDPNLHERLNKLFQDVAAIIKAGESAGNTADLTGGIRLGALGGTGVQAGGSLSVESSTLIPDTLDVGGGGIRVAGGLPVDTAPGLKVFDSPLAAVPAAPLVPETPAAPAAPAAPAVSLNEIVINPLEVADLETYAEHELETPKRRVSIAAKEANERVVEYAEHNDWKTPLENLVLGAEKTVYYKGADIVVRASDATRQYLVSVNDDTKERFTQFVSGHREAIEQLAKLTAITDEKKIIQSVTGIIDIMRRDVVQLHIDSLADDNDVSETIAAESVRFVNAYLSLLTNLVHNGLVLATNRGTEVAGINGRVELERKIDDIVFFSTDLYDKLADENGYCKEPDFFREVFLTVAASLGTLALDFDGSTTTLHSKTVDIMIPGNYPALERNNMIGRHSIGSTSDAVTDIFEYVRENAPDTNVFLVAPQGRFLLLSNGEPTAGIRY